MSEDFDIGQDDTGFPLLPLPLWTNVGSLEFSPELMQRQCCRSSARTAFYCEQQLAEAKDYHLYNFKHGYFSYRNASIRYRRTLFTPQIHVRLFLYYGSMRFIGLLLDNWKITAIHCHYKAWKSQDIFKYNWFDSPERRKSCTHRMAWVSKLR